MALDKAVDSAALDAGMSLVADAIRAKAGTTDPLAWPDGFKAAVEGIQTGGGTPGSGGQKDVNFYDYDGTIVASYSLSEAQSLTALPDGPTHDGLVFQGWNWTLEKINALTRPMNVGAMYITDDGKTRLHIRIATEGRMNVPLYISQTVANGVTIDWGDGSTTETLAGTGNVNTTHTYASIGDYTITLDPVEGCTLGLESGTSAYCVLGSTGNNGKVYCNMLQAVRIGGGVIKIGNYAFSSCFSLASITIPEGVTRIGDYAFYHCYSLASITIPDGVTSIDACEFYSCYSLASITIPDGVIGIYASAFYYCYSLAGITIPDSTHTIDASAFYSCYSLASITIPDGVTSISTRTFYCCYSLASITIPESVTRIDSYAFQNCYSLASITIPEGVTKIGDYAFSNCYSLASITIPDGVTSISTRTFYCCYSLASITIPVSVTRIGDYTFQECYSLASITIPGSVTKIGGYAFYSCYGMAEYHLKPTTPPTLSNTAAFSSIPSDCIIYVPQGCLEAYQNATNWTTYASYMQEEPA